MTEPKISVLTPIYRCDRSMLKNMIESVLNQTYKNFEFLLLDDCPFDSREDVIEEYNDNRITYIKNEENKGISWCRNYLLSLAKGEYVAILDHDDECMETRLEKQCYILDNNKEIGVVSSFLLLSTGQIDRYPINNRDIKISLMRENVVPHTACMIRKSVLLDNNISWEQDFSPAEDYMLMIRLLDKTLFYNIPEPLTKYYIYETSTSKVKNTLIADKADLIRNYAQICFPFFTKLSYLCNGIDSYWLFNIVPILTIKYKEFKKIYYFLGFIPVFKYKYRYKYK